MKHLILLLLLEICLVSCIKDDIIDDRVDPLVRITTAADSIAVGTTFEFNAIYLNNVGMSENADLNWTSSATSVISIDSNTGLATAHTIGSSTIYVQTNSNAGIIMDSVLVVAGENTVVAESQRSGTIFTSSSYTLTGSFTLSQIGQDLLLEIGDNYMASDNLPGLVVYLSNNPSTNAGAHEIADVSVYNGAHSYTIPNVDLNDYNVLLYFCAPFNVKVGHGDIQ